MGLTWLQPMYFFPVTEGAQHHDSEYIGTDSGWESCLQCGPTVCYNY